MYVCQILCDSSSYFKENMFQGLALKKTDRFHLELLTSLAQQWETPIFGFLMIMQKPFLTLNLLFCFFVFFCVCVHK